MPSPEPIPGKCGAKMHDNETGELRGYCMKPPMSFQTRCGSHGGKSPHCLAKARVRAIEHEATVALAQARPGIEPLDDPGKALDVLTRVHGEAVWFYDHLKEKAQDLIDANDLTVVTATQGEQLRAVLLAFERASERVHKLIVDGMRLGLDEKRLRLDEAMVTLHLSRLKEAFLAVLDDRELGLSPVQRERARLLIAERLS